MRKALRHHARPRLHRSPTTPARGAPRPVYVDHLPPCNSQCPAGENIQGWLFHAESGDYEPPGGS